MTKFKLTLELEIDGAKASPAVFGKVVYDIFEHVKPSEHDPWGIVKATIEPIVEPKRQ